MRTVVIGGTGHIGTYLIPQLVQLGHDVTVLSRGERTAYQPDAAWDRVQLVQVDRAAEDAAGTFGERVSSLEPDIVIDLICFTEDSARLLAEAIKGKVRHFLHCGTIWVHGPSVTVPTREDAPRRPFGDYGIQKAAIERYLLSQAQELPVTIIHPGHICGPGWTPINPAGNFDRAVYETLAKGEELQLPNFGLETINPVHAEDVASLFTAAIASRSTALGESFHAVASDAITLRGYAEQLSAWYGHEPNLTYHAWDDWAKDNPNAQATRDHISHSPNCSMEKAARLLGYRPRYSAFEAALAGIKALT